MKKLFVFFITLTVSFSSFGWGQIGHRAIGLVAQKHLTNKTKKKLRNLLKHESLAVASVWMDEEKSNPEYDHTHDWHWVTIENGKSYSEMDKNPNGDIIQTINRLIEELEKGGLSKEQEIIHIKMLVHLIGDIHQPLHVGNGSDKGGNDVKVEWFYNKTNLHSVWDSKMINSKQFSYTELAAAVDHVDDKSTIANWLNDDIMVWVAESRALHAQVYDLPENRKLSYTYMYENWDTVQSRLHQAGVRLAGVLNRIYG